MYNYSSNIQLYIVISNNPEFYDLNQSKRAFDFYKNIIEINNLHTLISMKESNNDNHLIVGEGRGIKYIDDHLAEFCPTGEKIVKRSNLAHRLKISNNEVYCQLRLGANGTVSNMSDGSYAHEDKIAFGSLDNYTLTELIDKHNNTCLRLCSETLNFVNGYDNIRFLPNHMQGISTITYEFFRLYTLEVWRKRELVKKDFPLLPPQDIIKALPITDMKEYVDFMFFNIYTESDYKKAVDSFIWQRYLEESKLSVEGKQVMRVLLNAIVDLQNKQRISRKGQKDVFLTDDEFLRSDTYAKLARKNEKYKLGLLKYDNGAVLCGNELS